MITTQDKKKNYTQIILIQEVLERRQFLIKAEFLESTPAKHKR